MFRPDVLMIAICLLIFVYLLVVRRGHLPYFALAFAVALGWVVIAAEQYGYNQEVSVFFGLSLFPLFAWTAGLFAVYFVYDVFLKNFAVVMVSYVALLIFCETVFYHLFNVKNLSTSMYDGLPICDCMHAPWWMQIAYFVMGPMYLGLCLVYLSRRKLAQIYTT